MKEKDSSSSSSSSPPVTIVPPSVQPPSPVIVVVPQSFTSPPLTSANADVIYDRIRSHLTEKALARFKAVSKDWNIKCTEVLVAKEAKDLGTLTVLPTDVVENILSKVSFKSYLKLRLVSKGWYMRVLELMKKKKSKMMVLIPSTPLQGLNLFGPSLVDLPRSTVYNGHRHIVVGSIEGAVLLVDKTYPYQTPFFYNPHNNDILTLPSQPQPTACDAELMLLDFNSYGLGYGETTSNVKVVMLSRHRAQKGMTSVSLNLSSMKWTPIPYKKRPITISSVVGAFVENSRKLFWIAHNDLVNQHLALGLDLKSMIFEEISFDLGIPIHTLGTIDGVLCSLVYVNKEEGAELKKESEGGEDEKEEEEEKEDRVLEKGKLEEKLLDEGAAWPAVVEGFFEVWVLQSAGTDLVWKTIQRTPSLFDDRFGDFYLLSFLDHGAILLKSVKKKTQDHTLLIFDVDEGISAEVTAPTNQTTLLVGNTHATEYVEAADALNSLSLCFAHLATGPVDSPSSSGSSSGSFDFFEGGDPDPEMTSSVCREFSLEVVKNR